MQQRRREIFTAAGTNAQRLSLSLEAQRLQMALPAQPLDAKRLEDGHAALTVAAAAARKVLKLLTDRVN